MVKMEFFSGIYRHMYAEGGRYDIINLIYGHMGISGQQHLPNMA